MSFGIGTLGSLGIGTFPPKRKYRWTFEAKAADGFVTFPQSFVKISDRPAFPYMMVGDENGGHEEYLPGELQITQFFTMSRNIRPRKIDFLPIWE
jgi:hypothetical protein